MQQIKSEFTSAGNVTLLAIKRGQHAVVGYYIENPEGRLIGNLGCGPFYDRGQAEATFLNMVYNWRLRSGDRP